MRWTQEQYDAYQARNKGARPCAGELQEPETSNPRQAHRQDADIDRSQGEEVDGQSCSFYRVSIVLNVSDKRERDADGSATTIMDTILSAIGRFVDMDRTRLRAWAKSKERRRRGHDNH